jgi:hypothetical protein
MVAGGIMIGLAGLSACQSTSAPHSGFLSSYAGLGGAPGAAKGPLSVRDDVASDAVERVYIFPAELRLSNSDLSVEEQAMVRSEVDRQICFEVSERFLLADAPSPDAATVRTAIVRIDPTNRAGSAVSAVAGFFIPIPVVKFRAPMTTGGLAVESELVAPDGRQAAALTWSHKAEVVGRVEPSMSRVGDALQLAEPLGDAVGDAFATEARKVAAIPNPDPCAVFGPRRNVGRMLANGLVGFGTGLYAPEVSGAGRAAEPAVKDAAAPIP